MSHSTRPSPEIIRNTLQRLVCYAYGKTCEPKVWKDVQIIVKEVEKMEEQRLSWWQRLQLQWRFGRGYRVD